jgi:hypothetical protein
MFPDSNSHYIQKRISQKLNHKFESYSAELTAYSKLGLTRGTKLL